MDIVVRMMGGLGNQLFQYAYARKLQEKYGANKIILDIREYKKYQVRHFELGSFRLNKSVVITNKLERNYKYDCSRYVYYFARGVLKKLCNQNLDWLFPVLSKYGLFYTAREIYDEKISKRFDILFLYGWFQDVRYIDDMKVTLLSEFVRRDKSTDNFGELLCQIRKMENAIAVSVRSGGDYMKAGYHICTAEYYKEGIKKLRSSVGNNHIFVFADEPLRAREMFVDLENITFVEGFDAIDQLLLMKDCHYFAISNSSFAWWGSYLSEYRDKIVYVPEFWYPNKKTENTRLVYGNVRILEL